MTRRFYLSMLCAGLMAAGAARTLADAETSEDVFSIPRGQGRPFVKQLPIKSRGRIVLDVTALPKDVDITLLLRRPDGTVAGRISGTGGNLSLTYFATEREVGESLAAKNTTWSVEVSKPASSDTVSGRLKIARPKQ